MPSAEGFTLYTEPYWISPYVFSAFVALKEKGVHFETSHVRLETGEQQAPGFAGPSLTARVPALRHGDFWLSESSAIVEYLEDVLPDRPRLLPLDVRERARARQVMAWLRSDLGALREERPTTTLFYAPATTPLTAAAQAAADKLLRVAATLVAPGRATLFREWSIADADLAFMLHRLLSNGHAVPPAIRAFAEAQWARPSVHAFVQRERPPQKGA
jgi:glutathione S-transferase